MDYRFVTAADMPLAAVVAVINAVYPADGDTLADYAASGAANNMDPAHSVLALEPSGAVAGLAMLGVRGARGWCGDAAVMPAHRNRGLGQMLMQRLSENARAYGLESLQLEVRAGNAPALRVYEKEGYKYTRRLHSFAAPLDELGWRAVRAPAELAIVRDPTGDALRRWHGTRFAAPPCWERELPSLLAHRHRDVWVASNAGREVACLVAGWEPGRARLNIYLLALANDATHADVRALCAQAVAETGAAALRVGLEPPESRLAEMLREFGFRTEEEFWEMHKTIAKEGPRAPGN